MKRETEQVDSTRGAVAVGEAEEASLGGSAGPELEILFQDDWYVAVHKPAGLLVHRTDHAPRGQVALLPLLHQQLGQWVLPVHRLDRKTSGILVVALHATAAAALSGQFEARQVHKRYLAVVRGWFDEVEGCIDRPLSLEPGEAPRPARTRFRVLAATERAVAVGPHPTSRYSLLEVFPETGRRQQIRRHFSGAAHPVIGDTSHGDRRHNEVIARDFCLERMLLMAVSVSFRHAGRGEHLTLRCPLDAQVAGVLRILFPDVDLRQAVLGDAVPVDD